MVLEIQAFRHLDFRIQVVKIKKKNMWTKYAAAKIATPTKNWGTLLGTNIYQGTFEDDFPFPQLGYMLYVSSLEGIYLEKFSFKKNPGENKKNMRVHTSAKASASRSSKSSASARLAASNSTEPAWQKNPEAGTR